MAKQFTLIIFLISLIGTLYLGRQYFSSLETFVPVVKDIRIGERSYSIFQNDKCVGESKVTFSQPHEELWLLSLDGYVNVSTLGQVKLKWDFSFNSLGQLGGSIFNGSVGSVEFKGGTLGVKPIRVILREPRNLEFPYTGPILLRKDGEIYSIALPIKRSLKTNESPFKVVQGECINQGKVELFDVTIPKIFEE